MPSFQKILLSSGRSNILLLFQDSAELRSSGGFLQSAVLLSFDNGFFVNQEILTDESIAATHYGEKAAYPEVTQYLGESQLYFRDSNWLADFSQANQDITWFVEQSTGERIDATIALNSKTLVQLLTVLGPLELKTGETIKAETFTTRLEEAQR